MKDSSTIPRQLVFDLPLQPGMGREDFLPAPANEAALRVLEEWPSRDSTSTSPPGASHALALVGPAGSGKSHLAEIWRLEHDALKATAADLHVEEAPNLLARGALVLEDMPGQPAGHDSRLPATVTAVRAVPEWETALFHLLNLARQTGASVLITSRLSPPLWPVRLPDLASRLAALPLVELLPPDDELLRAVLVKQFMDRQLKVPEEVISYLLTRMERSLAAARELVAALDEAALREKRRITRNLAARVLQALRHGEEQP